MSREEVRADEGVATAIDLASEDFLRLMIELMSRQMFCTRVRPFAAVVSTMESLGLAFPACSFPLWSFRRTVVL